MHAAAGGLDAVRRAGWRLPDALWDSLSEYERSFVALELGAPKSRDYYCARLRRIGFEGMNAVLDAGCGIGQWTVAGSALNRAMRGVDLNPARVDFARALACAEGIANVEFGVSRLESLPFPDRSFDGVICYGVFMFTDMPRALAEFRRVLRPGGRLYLNVNALGWYLHLLLDRGLGQRQWPLVRQALRMVVRGLVGRNSVAMVNEGPLRRMIAAGGFDLLDLDVEGHAAAGSEARAQPPQPAYPGRFYGARAVLEAVARRQDAAC